VVGARATSVSVPPSVLPADPSTSHIYSRSSSTRPGRQLVGAPPSSSALRYLPYEEAEVTSTKFSQMCFFLSRFRPSGAISSRIYDWHRLVIPSSSFIGSISLVFLCHFPKTRKGSCHRFDKRDCREQFRNECY